MHLEDFTINAYNTQIHGKYVQPAAVKGVVIVVHGLGEHSGRYLESVVPALLETELAVVLYDNIGHGKSGGKRGHCPSYEALLAILHQVIEKAVDIFPKTPLIVYGHSMGGNLVLNYALRTKTPLKGLVASSPYLRLAFKQPKWKMVMGKWLLNVMPSLTLSSGLDPNGISRIPEEVENYQQDPLIHDKVSPMYSFPVMEAGKWAIENAHQLDAATLLLHGTGDPIIDCDATIEFHENSQNTTLKLYESGFHELHHDSCKEEVIQAVQNWLQKQV